MPAGTSPTTTPPPLSSDMATTATPSRAASYVSLDRVGKTYASPRGPVAALVDVTLKIRPREFVSVVGPSGCGKSTLLKLSLIHISEPTRLGMISYAVFCLKKKKMNLIHCSQ